MLGRTNTGERVSWVLLHSVCQSVHQLDIQGSPLA